MAEAGEIRAERPNKHKGGQGGKEDGAAQADFIEGKGGWNDLPSISAADDDEGHAAGDEERGG
jgi:hypothetical protein